MSSLPNLLRSLLLTGVFSFLAPVMLLSILLAGAEIVSCLPYLESVGNNGVIQIARFLQVFGSGSVLQGLTVIGLVCSLVGILFDIYTFYRFQNWRDHQN